MLLNLKIGDMWRKSQFGNTQRGPSHPLDMHHFLDIHGFGRWLQQHWSSWTGGGTAVPSNFEPLSIHLFHLSAFGVFLGNKYVIKKEV